MQRMSALKDKHACCKLPLISICFVLERTVSRSSAYFRLAVLAFSVAITASVCFGQVNEQALSDSLTNTIVTTTWPVGYRYLVTGAECKSFRVPVDVVILYPLSPRGTPDGFQILVANKDRATGPIPASGCEVWKTRHTYEYIPAGTRLRITKTLVSNDLSLDLTLLEVGRDLREAHVTFAFTGVVSNWRQQMSNEEVLQRIKKQLTALPQTKDPHNLVSKGPTVKADFKGVVVGETLADAITNLQNKGYSVGVDATKYNGVGVRTDTVDYPGGRRGYISYFADIPKFVADQEGQCPYRTIVHAYSRVDAADVVLCGTDIAGKTFDAKSSKVIRIVAGLTIPPGQTLDSYLQAARQKYPDLPAVAGFQEGVSYRVVSNNPGPTYTAYQALSITISDLAFGDAIMRDVRRQAEQKSESPF